MKQYVGHAADVITENRYCAVATSSREGVPWNSPVYYSVDDSCRLFWISSRRAVHSRFLAENPRAFITIFDSQATAVLPATAVYLDGRVDTVEDSLLLDLILRRHFQRVGETPPYSGDSCQGDSPRRVYRFIPKRVWVLEGPDPAFGDGVSDRAELDLLDLCVELITRSTVAAEQRASRANEQNRYRLAR